jgi:low temperature requirement protein LtrA
MSAGYALFKSFPPAAVYLLGGAAALFLAASIAHPRLLAPFNRAWHRLGLLLGKVISPIVLGVIFFLVITPVAVVTRLAGRDALRLRKRSVRSHWVERAPPGPGPSSFRNQF